MTGSNDRTKNKGKSLYVFLLKNFIGLLCVVAFMLVVLISINTLVAIDLSDRESKSYRIDDYLEKLKAEEYDEIPAKKIFGKGGYIEVLDKNARVIYCSNKNIKTKYTKKSLNFISEVYQNKNYAIEKIGSQYGISGGGTMLLEYEWNPEKNDTELLGVAILDTKRNVKYSTLSIKRKKLTKEELNLINHSNIDDEYRRGVSLSKYSFTTQKGAERTVLIHTESVASQHAKLFNLVFLSSLIIFVISVILAIVLVGLHVVRKLKISLQELQNAISDCGENVNRESVNRIATQSGQITEFQQVITSFQNMDRRIQREEAKRKALQEERHQMLAGISHDMKTPITVIRGYVDAIRDGLVSPEEQDQYLKIIEAKATDMANLIDSLSEYNNITHPKFAYDFQRGDLTEYIRGYIASKWQELNLHGYNIEADIPEKSIFAIYDRKHLKRVWENIIGNSVKYTSPGTTLYFSLSVDEKARMAVIELGDNGSGLPENVREQVFEPFVVAESARSNGQGTGLGLTVVRDIVEAHGGCIRIEDSDGKKGLFYRIELPVISW